SAYLTSERQHITMSNTFKDNSQNLAAIASALLAKDLKVASHVNRRAALAVELRRKRAVDGRRNLEVLGQQGRRDGREVLAVVLECVGHGDVLPFGSEVGGRPDGLSGTALPQLAGVPGGPPGTVGGCVPTVD